DRADPVWPLPGGNAEIRVTTGSRPNAPDGVNRHVVKVPDTSLSVVEAVLPVMVVLSMTTVPPGRRSSPPPTPTPETPAAPGLPGKREPGVRCGGPRPPASTPPASPPAPPGPRLAWLPVMVSVVFDCLEPFF